MQFVKFSLAAALGLAAALPAAAHDGRRFEIEVVDNQLTTRGVNTVTGFGPDGTTVIDPAGRRPYRNAIHSHWDPIVTPSGSVVFTDLPGYDAGAGAEVLATHDVFLTLTGVSKWTDVSDDFVGSTPMITPGTVPDLQPLDAGESITVGFGGASVSTDDLGTANPTTLELITDFDGLVTFGPDGLANATTSNGYDRDVDYVYSLGVADTIDTLYVLEQQLSTNAPGILASETVYTIISPSGTGPFERLHFGSLYTEAYLGTPVPEPVVVLPFGLALTLAATRRRTA